MRRIINFLIELLAGWRVKDGANDWYEAHQKTESSRAEVEQIIRNHNATTKKG